MEQISENELVILIKTLSTHKDAEGDTKYDWDGVKIYMNGQELVVGKFELVLDATEKSDLLKAPMIKINDYGER